MDTSSTPIVFSKDHPLILRPKLPIGFTLETDTGTVIVSCEVPFEEARFIVTPGPRDDTVAVTFETMWLEDQ